MFERESYRFLGEHCTRITGEDDGVTGGRFKDRSEHPAQGDKIATCSTNDPKFRLQRSGSLFRSGNNKRKAADLLQLSRKYQRIPIQSRLPPSPSVSNRLRFHPCKQPNLFRRVSPEGESKIISPTPLRDDSTVEETEYHETIRYKFPSTLEKRYRKVSRSKFNNDSSSRKSKE